MGKRASELMDANEEIMPGYSDEENPAYVFTGPRSSYKPNIPQRLSKQQYDAISKIIRQWVGVNKTTIYFSILNLIIILFRESFIFLWIQNTFH